MPAANGSEGACQGRGFSSRHSSNPERGGGETPGASAPGLRHPAPRNPAWELMA